MSNYEKRPLIKKYAGELISYTAETFLENIAHDPAYNTRSYKHSSDSIAKQLITIIKDEFKIKSKSGMNIFYVETSKDFVKRIIEHLPIFIRKDPLIIQIIKAINKELQKMDLQKKERVNALSHSTNIELLDRAERIFGIKTDYSLGVKFRQNRLIARELTKYETFNNPYILKISKIFNVGKIIDIQNDKKNKVLTIVLEENIGNIKGFNEYIEHLREFSPAFYTINITN